MRLICLGIIVMAMSCKHKTAQQKFVDFINSTDNNITQKITVGEINATAKWMPYSYRKMIDSAAGNNEYNYFNVKFDKTGGNRLENTQMLYANFDIQKDFVLAFEKDSIAPIICQRIQNGFDNSYEYMLAFASKISNSQDFALVYNDKLFGIGKIAFVYKREDLKKIPTLSVK